MLPPIYLPNIHTHTHTSHNSRDCSRCFICVLSEVCHSVVCRFLISAFYPALEDISRFQRHRSWVTPLSLSFANGLKSRCGLDPETTWRTWYSHKKKSFAVLFCFTSDLKCVHGSFWLYSIFVFQTEFNHYINHDSTVVGELSHQTGHQTCACQLKKLAP